MTKMAVPGNICQKNKCHHCCIETEMLLLKSDASRISKSTGIKTSNFSFMTKENQRMLKNKTTNDEKVCFFLEEKGRCSIYDIRPEGCTYYPIIWDLINQHAVTDDYCPYHEEFKEYIENIQSNLELFVLKLYGWL